VIADETRREGETRGAEETVRERRALPFTARSLLAPMEGVTEPCFRELVLAQNSSEHLGGAFTEFARVVREPLPKRALCEHLGLPREHADARRERADESAPKLTNIGARAELAAEPRSRAPVGLQLMGSDLASLAITARRAFEIGAPLVDLNFGCPAKGAIRTCAGSALLREPRAVEDIVRACAEAASEIPVTAKIRAGYDDASLLEDLARAAEAGGAAMLTVHCRTRAEAFQDEVDWSRIARAVSAVAIPVCGNGGIRSHEDFERMRRETGCAFAMAGRAALGDPWIFSGARVTRSRAARFLLDYAEALMATSTSGPRGAAGRVKQLLRYWTAGDLVRGERERWMREPDENELFARLRSIAAEREAITAGCEAIKDRRGTTTDGSEEAALEACAQ
jgi:tRNA-dihydrouridine synthase C